MVDVARNAYRQVDRSERLAVTLGGARNRQAPPSICPHSLQDSCAQHLVGGTDRWVNVFGNNVIGSQEIVVQLRIARRIRNWIMIPLGGNQRTRLNRPTPANIGRVVFGFTTLDPFKCFV